MKILLHSCCGPCSIYPIKTLKLLNYDVELFFYNHNIHPVVEYYKRLEAFVAISNNYQLKYHLGDGYGLMDFLSDYQNGFDNRCLKCYTKRIEKTCQKALELGIGSFSTTLLYSKMQKHFDIKSICEKFAEQYDLTFIYHDFRDGWNEGIEESKLLGIYRQNYCGCILSEEDRFLNQLTKKYSSLLIR